MSIDGADFIRLLRQDETLRHIPIVELATPNQRDAMLNSLACGAAGCIVRLDAPDHSIEMIGTVHHLLGLESRSDTCLGTRTGATVI